jgi:hypothetical protein
MCSQVLTTPCRPPVAAPACSITQLEQLVRQPTEQRLINSASFLKSQLPARLENHIYRLKVRPQLCQAVLLCFFRDCFSPQSLVRATCCQPAGCSCTCNQACMCWCAVLRYAVQNLPTPSSTSLRELLARTVTSKLRGLEVSQDWKLVDTGG